MFYARFVRFSEVWTIIVPTVVFAVVLSVITVRQCRRTKDRSFLWLWVGLVACPLTTMMLLRLQPVLIDAVATILRDGRVNIMLVRSPGERSLRTVALMIVAVHYSGYLITAMAINSLYRNHKNRNVTDTNANKRAGDP